MKYLVLYSYFEKNESTLNLYFFLNNGLFECDHITYIFIIKGKKLSVKIPNYKNVIVKKTKNSGYDFGGWSDGLKLIKINDYDKLFF